MRYIVGDLVLGFYICKLFGLRSLPHEMWHPKSVEVLLYIVHIRMHADNLKSPHINLILFRHFGFRRCFWRSKLGNRTFGTDLCTTSGIGDVSFRVLLGLSHLVRHIICPTCIWLLLM